MLREVRILYMAASALFAAFVVFGLLGFPFGVRLATVLTGIALMLIGRRRYGKVR
jgi:hypothetical protein